MSEPMTTCAQCYRCESERLNRLFEDAYARRDKPAAKAATAALRALFDRYDAEVDHRGHGAQA